MEPSALFTTGGTTLGSIELDDEPHEGAVIRRGGEPDWHLVGRIESDDPGMMFDVLIVERV